MKVDTLPKYYRALAMLEWFKYVHGDRAIMLSVESYYDADQKEVKESIQGLYNRYWDILKNAFSIEPYRIDFEKYTKDDCSKLLENIANHFEGIVSDQDAFCDKIENSPCEWDPFLREMSTTLINIHTNSFIATSPDVEVLRALNNSYMIHVHLEEKLPRYTFDDLVGTIEKNISAFVTEFICEESLIERLHALISMLSSLRSAYYQCGRDIRSILISPEYEGKDSEFTQDVVQKLQKAFDNIKDFEHYRSLFIELRDLCNEDVNSDPMELLEKYYKILDEVYFDVYSLGTLVPSLVEKYNESHGGNEK